MITEFACQDNADSSTKPFNQTDVIKFMEDVIPWF